MKLGIQQASTLLGISAETLYQQLHRGSGYAPCFTKDEAGQWKADRQDLMAKQIILGDISRGKRPRMETIKVYLTGEEAKQVRAKAQDKSVSAFCRWLINRGLEV